MDIKPTSGPRDFFVHLLGFGALYASAVSLIGLWFQYINLKFPDPLQPYFNYGYEQLRVPMAALIVVFPVFLFLARWISKQIALDPERKELRIYKWLVYFTLFVSAVTVIIDLITLIYNFLGGELTARFGLKVLVVLIVALGVFGYYLWHLRSDVAATAQKRRLLMWATIVVVLGSILMGFVFVGSPATARARRFDQQRVNDLQTISWQIQSDYSQNKKLPTNPSINLVDPETKQPYEYMIQNDKEYTLCAVFHLPGGDPDWGHDAGHYCFWLTAEGIPMGKPTRIYD